MTGKPADRKPHRPSPGPAPGKAAGSRSRALAGRLPVAAPPLSLSPLASALRVFDKAAAGLGLDIEARLKLLNMGRSKYFELRSADDPVLDVDRRDRIGYFLAIYELSGRLVGSPGAWLEAVNQAPLFAGRPPLERILGGRMEDLIATLAYLKGAYGGWA